MELGLRRDRCHGREGLGRLELGRLQADAQIYLLEDAGHELAAFPATGEADGGALCVDLHGDVSCAVGGASGGFYELYDDIVEGVVVVVQEHYDPGLYYHVGGACEGFCLSRHDRIIS